jgi:hypothetical protein
MLNVPCQRRLQSALHNCFQPARHTILIYGAINISERKDKKCIYKKKKCFLAFIFIQFPGGAARLEPQKFFLILRSRALVTVKQ